MAIGADSLVEITLNMQVGSITMLNVWQYLVSQHTPGVDAVQLAEAWWNQVKVPYRALAVSGWGTPFQSVRIRELNNSAGDYAEFDIPSGEQAGTRSNPTDADLMPYHIATAARLTVGTRLTRPGHKRFPFATQNDVTASTVASAWKTLIGSVLNSAIGTLTLGSPALLEVIDCIVCKKDSAGTVVASQKVTGYVLPLYVSSQNTRKVGRGI